MIPFSPPHIDEEAVELVSEVLRSGWITTGPRTKEFEKELASYTGAPKVLCVNSATAGMELILHWYGVGEGDEVIIPSYTYCATAHVVKKKGAIPVMVDVSENSTSIDPKGIAERITSRTKAIIPVDVGGYPCDQDGIMELVNSPAIKKKFQPSNDQQDKMGRPLVLLDAAHSFGASLNERKVGSITDITVFSFHAVKNLTTAEGGAIVFSLDQELFDVEKVYNRLNTITLHGQSKDALNKFSGGGWRYDVKELGYKCNMTDIQAALGLVQLRKYDNAILPRRKAIFDKYNEGFKDLSQVICPVMESDGMKGAYHLYMLQLKGASEEDRDRVIQDIIENGVSANVHFLPLPMLSYYKDLGFRVEDHPNAFDLYKSEISLPLFYDLKDEQVGEVIETVRRSIEKNLSN